MPELDSRGFFHNKEHMLSTALVLSLIALFVINIGLRAGTWLYTIGLILLVIGILLAPLTRFTAEKQESDDDKEQAE